LQTLIGASVVNGPLAPGLDHIRMWDPRGLAIALLLHVGFSEPVFYWAHRALHRAPLFGQYHAAHHSTPVTHPLTGTYAYDTTAVYVAPAELQPNSDSEKRRDKACVRPVIHDVDPSFFSDS
jgi:hypothetical protein